MRLIGRCSLAFGFVAGVFVVHLVGDECTTRVPAELPPVAQETLVEPPRVPVETPSDPDASSQPDAIVMPGVPDALDNAASRAQRDR